MDVLSRIVVFDVETPNFNNDRICSIGISIIEDGRVVKNDNYLVNPECGFDYRNIGIHGIRPEDVASAPSFPVIWKMIREDFLSNLLVAHNAIFDLGVLKKTLYYYGFEESLVYYVDTLRIARALLKDTANHKLPTLCYHYDIELNHHDSGSDSNACAELLLNLIEDGAVLDNYVKEYKLGELNEPTKDCKIIKLSDNNSSLLNLSNILSNITCDNELDIEEVEILKKWLDENVKLKGNFPYDKIFSVLGSVLADGLVDQSELDYMLKLFKQITDPVNEYAIECGIVDVSGKNICLSGVFDCGSKSFVNEKLIEMGAIINKAVTKNTDILLVGGQGSSAWCSGNYGTKVKKALELQEKGIRIIIYREEDFFKCWS